MAETNSAQSSTNTYTFVPALKLTQSSNNSLNLVAHVKLDRNSYLLWKYMILPAMKGNQLENFIHSKNPNPKFIEDDTTTPNPKYRE